MIPRALLLGFAALIAGAQVALASDYPIEAKTSDGKTVNLYEDGTWRPKTLKVDHEIIRKDKFATSVLQSRLRFYEFWYDPKLWQPEEPAQGEAFEVVFTYQGATDEAWCGIIPERSQMTQDALVGAVFQNFQSAAADTKMLQRSRAYVNSLRGDIVEMTGTFDGFHIAYSTFAWSGNPGTVQITCWTFPNLLDEYRPIFGKFYGGFELKG